MVCMCKAVRSVCLDRYDQWDFSFLIITVKWFNIIYVVRSKKRFERA